MKIVIDNQLVRVLKKNPASLLNHPLVSHHPGKVAFGWPSFLEYLNLDLLLPTIDESHPLFVASVATLHSNPGEEALLYVYDNLFAVTLTQVKTHPQMNAPFLLHALKTERQKEPALEPLLSSILNQYEERLTHQAADAMHDLILYLAWDRMCVTLGRLFDYQSTDPHFHHGLAIFKQCLIESYQHIASQRKTIPSLYRLFEALLFYEMREENLDKHKESEWEVFARTFPVLKDQDEFPDFLYIDESGSSAHFLTLETPEQIAVRLTFVEQMSEKLRSQIPQWNHTPTPKNITSLA